MKLPSQVFSEEIRKYLEKRAKEVDSQRRETFSLELSLKLWHSPELPNPVLEPVKFEITTVLPPLHNKDDIKQISVGDADDVEKIKGRQLWGVHREIKANNGQAHSPVSATTELLHPINRVSTNALMGVSANLKCRKEVNKNGKISCITVG